jgi:hypothetical protein
LHSAATPASTQMHDDRCMAGPAGNCFAHPSARVLLPPPLSQPRQRSSPTTEFVRRRRHPRHPQSAEQHISGTGSGHRLTPAHRWRKEEHSLGRMVEGAVRGRRPSCARANRFQCPWHAASPHQQATFCLADESARACTWGQIPCSPALAVLSIICHVAELQMARGGGEEAAARGP